ncbi:MAG: nitroreductase family protein [Bacteroidota bacterium]|nr:nitroreductase family protein [Bacteroidota bacterium]
MNSIFKRRSIRQYTKQEVSEDDVKNLLEAAMCAPSASNVRPWHFVVVRDKAMLEKLSLTHQYAYMVKNASVAIVVCGDYTLHTHKDYWVLDCSAAAENILIEVTELNLGAVWVAVYPRETRIEHVRNVLKLPENIIPLCVIPMGYPAEKIEPINKLDQSRIHVERW